LLRARRQLAGDGFFAAAQHERLHDARQRLPRRPFFPAIGRDPRTEGRRRPEHPRVQELEQAPKLAQVVLDRRSGQRQAVPADSSRAGLSWLGSRRS
jgi:hypothetical protein